MTKSSSQHIKGKWADPSVRCFAEAFVHWEKPLRRKVQAHSLFKGLEVRRNHFEKRQTWPYKYALLMMCFLLCVSCHWMSTGEEMWEHWSDGRLSLEITCCLCWTRFQTLQGSDNMRNRWSDSGLATFTRNSLFLPEQMYNNIDLAHPMHML